MVKLSPEKTLVLLNLVMPTSSDQRSALVEALQGGPLQPLTVVVDALMHAAVLFRSTAYDAAALEFVDSNPGPWETSDPLSVETVRRASLYAKLAANPDPAYEPGAVKTDAAALRSLLAMPGSIAAAVGHDAKLDDIAGALKSDVALVSSVLPRMALASGDAVASRLDELSQLAAALSLTTRVGVSAEMLRLAVSDSASELA